MLTSKYNGLLRTALISKLSISQSVQVPQLFRVDVTVKADRQFDLINNLCVLTSLGGSVPRLNLVNTQKVLLLPKLSFSNQLLKLFLNGLLPKILAQITEKVLALSHRAHSNNVTFNFKASDLMSPMVRKVWKLLETEVGSFELELTFTTSSTNDLWNETLLRSYQLPVVVQS